VPEKIEKLSSDKHSSLFDRRKTFKALTPKQNAKKNYGHNLLSIVRKT
jgi:hypothetical protein